MTAASVPPTQRPTLLTLGMLFSFLAGGVFLIVSIGAALGLADTSALRDTPWGSWAVPVWGMSLLIFGGLLVAIAIGIRKRLRWARHLMILFWVLLACASLANLAVSKKADLLWVVALPLAAWYLYGKSNVVRYFAGAREA